MNAEFIAMLEYLEKEKGIKRDVLIEAVQSALLSAAKKSVEAGRNLEVVMDPKTGAIQARAQTPSWRRWRTSTTRSRFPRRGP